MNGKKTDKKKKEFTQFQEKSYFNGILNFKNPLNILGKFNGKIQGETTLQIGSSALVEANISVKNLIVYGKVIGNVYAKEKVELKNGSSLIGNIKSTKLEIDEGVIFEGQCEMQEMFSNSKKV